MVKFKSLHKREADYVPYAIKKNRQYEDYIAFIDEHPDVSVVQFDTVIGSIGDKVIMTIHFTNLDFIIYILLDNKTSAEAALKIRFLKSKLSAARVSFVDIVPVILTDNDGEFSNVSVLKND